MKSNAFRKSCQAVLPRLRIFVVLVLATTALSGASLGAQDRRVAISKSGAVSRTVLTDGEWHEVEAAVDRGLAFLKRQHRQDGSFQQTPMYDPGISALCVMAFLSRGHLPDQGPYGNELNRSVDFLLGCQQHDGLISRARVSRSGQYNHAICALVITELYGMSQPKDEARFRKVIQLALDFTSHRNSQPKAHADDQGSWRYLQRRRDSDGDLSVTSWSVMFLRSAKNSGFDIDVQLIDEALAYMKRTYDPRRKTFRYEIHAEDPPMNYPRGMAAAGALSLSLSGEHQSPLARNAADYILRQPFDQYERPNAGEEHPCYGAFYCSQAMFHMGEEYWSEFYPRLVKTLLKAQRADGSWLMKQGEDAQYGPAYMTALTILALTPPYQFLPIFQR